MSFAGTGHLHGILQIFNKRAEHGRDKTRPSVRLAVKRGRDIRNLSNTKVPVRPPNMMKCTILSAPSNRLISSSPRAGKEGENKDMATSTAAVGW